MSELDANIIVDGQKTIAATKIEGEIIKSGGKIDATCSVQDSDGKKHLAIKVFPIESEETSKNELAAQVLTNNNELAVVMQEQEGSIISENENDFNCLVETENNEKQKAVKTIILDGTLIKSGGAIDTTCIVQDGDGNKQLALKVFNLGGSADWQDKPADWSDIRKDCPANSIALYAGHTPLQQWTLGDRLDNKATFVGYFDSVDPDTNTAQRYAYFVLDAAYRSTSALKDNSSGVLSADSPIPVNATYTDALARTESATYNCAKLEAAGTFPPIDFAKAVSVNYNGNTYYGVIPNATELLEIYNNRETLDTYDPTITDYATLSLTEWASTEKSRVWTSNGGDASTGNGLTFWEKKKTGTGNNAWYIPTQINNLNFAAAAFPIIEIPVDNSNIQYDNLGFTATCVGGYNVFIDGTQYGTTYASGAQCTITWSTSGITTGDDITTPSALKAHKIWIVPAVAGNNITDFTGARVVSGSGYENQGFLWVHFNIDTSIFFRIGEANGYRNHLIKAITAKNNLLNVRSLEQSCHYCNDLIYVPLLVGPNTTISTAFSSFSYCNALQKLNFKNIKVRTLGSAFFACPSLLKLPKIDFSETVFANRFAVNTTSLKDTIIDMSSATGLKTVGIYGDSTHRINGLKGLRVSNEAPFDYTVSPQIDVSYTGLDRNALVQLFNDLPYNVGYEVVGSPTISSGVVSDFSSSNYLQLSSGLNLKNFTEAIFKIKIDSSTFDEDNINFYLFQEATRLQVYFNKYQNYGVNFVVYAGGSNHSRQNRDFPIDTWFYLKLAYDGTTFEVYRSSDGTDWGTAILSFALDWSSISDATTTTIGKNAYNSANYFRGQVDLNETYIKVNDVYYFRGQPAMTKTLSCVGAAGTADLTAEDKDIALNKGWSLTLS